MKPRSPQPRWTLIAAATLLALILTPTVAATAMHPIGLRSDVDAAGAAELLGARAASTWTR